MIKSKYGFPDGMMFWFLSFIYALLMALMFQKLIVPMLSNLHAGNGLLNNDAILFHNLACHAAELIREQGWSQWSLYQDGFGNVGILSAIYALFGPDPVFFIPFNAAAHATGALMIYLLGQRLWPGKVGYLGGLIAAVLFLIFPSSLQWYGQNHKDAFAIVGILMILFAWLSVFDREYTGSILLLILLMFGGVAILAAVRAHYPLLTLIAFSVSWVTLFAVSVVKRSLRRDRRALLAAVCLMVVIFPVSMFSASKSHISEVYSVNTLSVEAKMQNWTWTRSEILPEQIDRAFEKISRIRTYFVMIGLSVGAGSMIDIDRLPDDAESLAAYLPRALVVGLFAPFPNTWTERVSPPRLVGAVETLVWYILFTGIIVLLAKRSSRPLFAGLIFSLCIIVLLGCVNSNIGTLYRQRFGFWFFILLCGATGWAKIILSNVFSRKDGYCARPDCDAGYFAVGRGTDRMETLAASGTVVLLITFCCYLGFMARDLMLVRICGMNAELDAYFAAVMIPMFLVTFLAHPISDALTAPFLRKVVGMTAGRSDLFMRKAMFFAIVMLGGVVVLVIFLADELLPFVIGTASVSTLEEGSTILRLYAPLILLSAWTVFGNCILNTLHRSRQAALAQLLVPAAAIVALLLVPAEKVLYGAVIGMLLGTLLNIIALWWFAKMLGYKLWPVRPTAAPELRIVSQQYSWLAAAAFFTVVATPINYVFAGTIERGAISVWALAGKMVTLFNGLAGVGIAAVVLPHLARLMAGGYAKEVKNDVFFLLITGTWIGFGLALVVFVFSEPIIFTLFHGGLVTDEKVKELADVVKIGCIQLPMVVACAVIVKIAAVTGRSVKAVLAALTSIIINIGCNFVFVPLFGVLGLALSSVIAVGGSSVFLLMVTRNENLLSITEVLVLIFSWIILAFISVSFHFGYSGALASAGFGIFSLAGATWWICRSRGDDEFA
jgi:putative peptidoglycan lipid II flippase